MEGVTESDLGSRKGRLLVKVLAVARGTPVSVATLTEVLWGDEAPSHPSDQLGVLVSRLRKTLGSDRLSRSEAGFTLRVDWLDVDALRDLVVEASSALRDGRLAAARAAADAALALARGDVLPEDDGEWLEPERAAVAASVTRARGLVAAAALQAGDHVTAELAAEAALVADPFDEVSLRVLMQAQTASGRAASALASYAKLRRHLAEELGVSPSAETEALHSALLTAGDVDVALVERPRARLIGRDREVALLDAQLADLQATARVVVVVGEAGIGKTALVEHFIDRARRSRARIRVTRADELGRDLPLQPLLDAAGIDAAVAAAVGIGDRPATTVPDTGGDQARWFAAVLAALTTEASPLVLVLENAERADRTTSEWMRWVQGRAGALLVVVVGRPGTGVSGAVEVAVGPLDRAAIEALIDVDGDAIRADAVYRRSGGNPLFALALAGATQGDDDELPHTVQQTVASTLSRLDQDAADVVRVGAVLDAALDVDLLAAVMDVSAIDVIERMERAASVGLLDESGAGFVFRHALVREALVATTGAARRALLHRDAARVLQERPGGDVLAVAVHARLGGATTIAADAFRDAAALSLARSDLSSAEDHLRASLHAIDRADIHTRLARVLMSAQRLDEAAVEAVRAIELGGGPSALEVAGWVDYYRRRYESAQRYADEAVERADPTSPVRASGLALGGRVRHGGGDTAGAQRRLVDALASPPAVRGVAEVWLGHLRVHEGRPSEALELIDHALIDPSHLAHPFAPLHGRFGRVFALGQLGRVADALLACGEFRDAIDAAGAVGQRFRAVERNVRAWVLRGAGRLAEADELNMSAIALNGASDGSGPNSEGLAEAYWVGWLDLADGHLAREDFDGAASALRLLAAIETWNGTMAWHQRHRLGLVRARVAHAAGDDARAAELATVVMDDAVGRGTARYAALAHVQLALAGADGDRDRIDRSLTTLRGCAALELPRLLDALGRTFRDDELRREADERSAQLSSGSWPR